jgi:indolepyruvate ferredoxin oxidoreductase alpha subunit
MGKDVMPLSGGYSGEVIARGLVDFLGETNPAGLELEALRDQAAAAAGRVEKARHALDIHVPPRPPGFCTGCPERPVFTAIKLLKEEIGDVHISTDIGCHSFATFEPFSLGNTILGYGMSLASAAVIPVQKKRPIAIMGDGGFWHNGLQTGVISNLFNQSDGILIIMQNGYSSATGQQYIPSSGQVTEVAPMTGEIENTLRGLGVEWLKSVRTYSVEAMLGTLREAMETDVGGLKVIIADAECMLARQRCLRLADAERLKYGQRVETPRFGIDDEVCTGDHSCIRLSGCPSLTLAPNPDPLRIEPIAQVNNGCLGCGLCGEVAHAAVTCPSFYEAKRIQNPDVTRRIGNAFRRHVIAWMTGKEASS